MIPTFVDGDVVVVEASVIVIYLAEKVRAPLVRTGNAKSETLKWIFWAAEHFRRRPAVLIEQRLMERLKGHIEEESLVREALHAINRDTSVLDERLGTRQFMVGEALTLADFDLAAPLSQIPRTRAPLLEYPHVAAWYERVSNIVAWQATGLDQGHRIREIGSFFA